MAVKLLAPDLELLSEEYVLIQAWKKTASYIRRYNWYSDTLDLDCVALNLPDFIDQLRERLQSWEDWEPHPLRFIPAPKSQSWKIEDDKWVPDDSAIKLRPLAHVSLADQVVATALMLCLADRIETIQGDPSESIDEQKSRNRVVSYGHRLFCKERDGFLRHRWGGTKLYRAYFQDYRMFISRPEIAAKQTLKKNGNKVFVVHADLKQFYDCITPKLLNTAINRVRHVSDDSRFFDLLLSTFRWSWHSDDKQSVRRYTDQTGLKHFAREVSLPQGLVASGFFANVVLLSVDEELRETIGTEIAPNILLVDVCRYVDDFRVVVAVDGETVHSYDSRKAVSEWLQQLLTRKAEGLELSTDEKKTKIVEIGGEKRPLVRQSVKMNRIQEAVSGGFDALGGGEILDAIQGLFVAQDTFTTLSDEKSFSPVPDVRDVTVARFGAARYRTTFRSIRPLLHEKALIEEPSLTPNNISPNQQPHHTRTQDDLDEDARVFALGLVQRWIKDPANIRLLKIGLDLWPDHDVLTRVLALLRTYTEEETPTNLRVSQVVWYCLAEILRAGATETGIVKEDESLPSGLNIESYRKELCQEAIRLIDLPPETIPWYLQQQALLFLAVYNPNEVTAVITEETSECRHYLNLIKFLRGDGGQFEDSDFVTYAVLARRTFMNRDRASELTIPDLNRSRIKGLAEIDPSFILELRETKPESVPLNSLPRSIREYLCLVSEAPTQGTLAHVVLDEHPHGPLRNELSILHFAEKFLRKLKKLAEQNTYPKVVTPEMVRIELSDDKDSLQIDHLSIVTSKFEDSLSIYAPPSWCSDNDLWRIQLGFLLRFILSGHPDFTRSVQPSSRQESEMFYRSGVSHWRQRMYGLYSGYRSFGDDWVPITDWLETFLLALLSWPGCSIPSKFSRIGHGIDEGQSLVSRRIRYLNEYKGDASGVLILPLKVKPPVKDQHRHWLRVCVIQTVKPTLDDFKNNEADLTLSSTEFRQIHRRHLSAALEAIKKTIELRRTHKGKDGSLDWLILPELAVHPRDVHTHLVPFSRAYKTIILTGLTFEEIFPGQPLVNSALWIVPEWSNEAGLQIKIRRQGKEHLAAMEKTFKNRKCEKMIQEFRPCQWLIEYPWSIENKTKHLRLTASVCYDATDLALAADLRRKSDVLAIPALNKDVKTFDNMAMALHYHMFQAVVIVNNGEYGGSSAYWPSSDSYKRQIFHTHGQPQAAISFIDIDDIAEYQERTNIQPMRSDFKGEGSNSKWKYPPANLIENRKE